MLESGHPLLVQPFLLLKVDGIENGGVQGEVDQGVALPPFDRLVEELLIALQRRDPSDATRHAPVNGPDAFGPEIVRHAFYGRPGLIGGQVDMGIDYPGQDVVSTGVVGLLRRRELIVRGDRGDSLPDHGHSPEYDPLRSDDLAILDYDVRLHRAHTPPLEHGPDEILLHVKNFSIIFQIYFKIYLIVDQYLFG